MENRSFWGKIEETVSLAQPLVEITGIGRILIEHHRGIEQYAADHVAVRMPYGCMQILGTNLTVTQMTSEQLVICGELREILLGGGLTHR